MKKAVHILKSSLIDNYLENKLTIDELKLIGFSIETLLVSCTFRGRACDKSDFTFRSLFQHGNCFTFNADFVGDDNLVSTILPNLKTLSGQGSRSSLELELFSGIEGVDIFFSFE